MSKTKIFKFPNLQEAWLGINEYLANDYEDILKHGGGISGNQVVLYNAIVKSKTSAIDPSFDFGHVLGYTMRKWTKLISNYVDRDMLDLTKALVIEREVKKTTQYTHTFHFSNAHVSGKDCLISLTFSRNINSNTPVVYYHTRATEATKRMIFDFLLVQRLVEYVYGYIQVEVVMYMPFVFISADGVLLCNGAKPIKELVRNWDNPNNCQKRVITAWDKLYNTHISKIPYKVHQRAAKAIQMGGDGKPLHGRDALVASTLTLFKPTNLSKGLLEKLNKG